MVAPMVIAAGITAAGALASSLMSNSGASAAADKANQFSEYMYRNRYQWQVEDMKKAGLNPANSYGYSAPSTATGVKADYSMKNFAGEGAQTALAAASTAADIKAKEAAAQEATAGADYKSALADSERRGQGAGIPELTAGKLLADANLSQDQGNLAKANRDLAIVDAALKREQIATEPYRRGQMAASTAASAADTRSKTLDSDIRAAAAGDEITSRRAGFQAAQSESSRKEQFNIAARTAFANSPVERFFQTHPEEAAMVRSAIVGMGAASVQQIGSAIKALLNARGLKISEAKANAFADSFLKDISQ